MEGLATWAGMPKEAFAAALKLRKDCLHALSLKTEIGMDDMYEAIAQLRAQEAAERHPSRRKILSRYPKLRQIVTSPHLMFGSSAAFVTEITGFSSPSLEA